MLAEVRKLYGDPYIEYKKRKDIFGFILSRSTATKLLKARVFMKQLSGLYSTNYKNIEERRIKLSTLCYWVDANKVKIQNLSGMDADHVAV